MLFSKHLIKHGHKCAIAIPSGPIDLANIPNDLIQIFSYEQILEKKGAIFPNGECADVLHACTPRIIVYEFICKYMNIHPTPLAIYLEDNEEWITQETLGVNEKSILALTDRDIDTQLPKHLSHPFNSTYFIALCDLAILIQEKLACTVPFYIPTSVVPWGVELVEFQSHPENIEKARTLLNIPSGFKVIVYHGGINPYTQSSIRDLCDAIHLINDQGIPCILLRTGPGPISDMYPNSDYLVGGVIRDLGVLPRSELPNILNAADIFVQPGRINPFEDLRLPSKVPEFLAMGRPVILPNCNISHLFKDRENAMILNVGDSSEIARKCVEVFADSALSIKLSMGAREKAEQYFDIEKQTLDLIDAYKKTIESFDKTVTKSIWNKAISSGPLLAAFMRMRYLGISSPKMYENILDIAIKKIEFDQERIATLSDRLDEPTLYFEGLQIQIEELNVAINLQGEALKQEQILNKSLLSSTSWKITSPLRWLSNKMRS